MLTSNRQDGSAIPVKQRTRVSHPKTKTGCTTCRKRRVKCDETLPSCLNCIKFWGYCDGYSNPQRRTTRTKLISPTPSKILSRPLPTQENNNRSLLSPPNPYQFLSKFRFNTQQESDNFQTFTSDLAIQLPGFFTSTVWSQVILQASHAEEFVKDAVIAIGALHACGRRLVENTHSKVSSGIEVTPRYRFALQKWGRALRKMQKRISGDEKGLRMALIACLLVVCFENLQGSYFQGLKHALSGHALLQAWLVKHGSGIGGRKEGMESPAPHIIEDELVQSFSRLDLQIMGYVDPRDIATHQALKDEGKEVIRHMPGVFTSIDEARNYWELVQRRTSHFIATIALAAQAKGHMQEMVSIGAGVEVVKYYSESVIMLSLSPTQGQDARQQCLAYSGEIKRWFSAFSPFYATLPLNTRTWIAASILHIQAQTSEIMLLSSIFGDEFSLDNFMDTFRELVSLGEKVAEDIFFKKEHLFTFDTLLVNPIRLIAKWCREPAIRREAIALLRKLAVREGIWDALTMASVTEYVMWMEEEGMDEEGHIPRGMRVRVTGIVIDDLKRKATISCTRFDRSEGRVTVVEW